MRTLPEHCPALHELQRFAVGDLPSHDCEIISAHLPQCNDCIERVVSFQNDGDGLIAALRTVPEASLLNEQDAERINALVERIASTSFQQRNDAHQLEFEPGEMVDEYEILERLPGGGMGRVYRVRHRTLGKIFALKIIRKEFDDHQRATARFRREILAGGMLNHPNIVQATDARVVNGQTILVMEFVDGMDIAKLLKRATTIEIADACEIGRQACLGLQHAHGRGYIHRDIKPSNLILGRDGKVKILDLGLIRLLEPDDNSEAISEVGSFLGTPEYTSPEQARGGPLAASTDLYSLGCTLYELLAGAPPFSRSEYQSRDDILLAHLQDDVKPLTNLRENIPRSLGDIVQRLLSKDPERRFQSAAELGEALAPFCQSSNLLGLFCGESPPNDMPQPLRELPRTRRGISISHILTTAGVLVLLIISAFFIQAGFAPEREVVNGSDPRPKTKSTTPVNPKTTIVEHFDGLTNGELPVGWSGDGNIFVQDRMLTAVRGKAASASTPKLNIEGDFVATVGCEVEKPSRLVLRFVARQGSDIEIEMYGRNVTFGSQSSTIAKSPSLWTIRLQRIGRRYTLKVADVELHQQGTDGPLVAVVVQITNQSSRPTRVYSLEIRSEE